MRVSVDTNTICALKCFSPSSWNRGTISTKVTAEPIPFESLIEKSLSSKEKNLHQNSPWLVERPNAHQRKCDIHAAVMIHHRHCGYILKCSRVVRWHDSSVHIATTPRRLIQNFCARRQTIQDVSLLLRIDGGNLPLRGSADELARLIQGFVYEIHQLNCGYCHLALWKLEERYILQR